MALLLVGSGVSSCGSSEHSLIVLKVHRDLLDIVLTTHHPLQPPFGPAVKPAPPRRACSTHLTPLYCAPPAPPVWLSKRGAVKLVTRLQAAVLPGRDFAAFKFFFTHHRRCGCQSATWWSW